MIRTYRNLPPIVSGYPLDDVWSVIVPVARTNEVLNPSGETNTTGYTAGSGTLTRSTEQQYHGAYSFKYVPAAATTDGFFYGTISTTAGQIRAIHCKFRGAAGIPYALTFATTGGVDLVTKPFVASGRWQWIILYYTETSSTTRRIYFRKNGSVSVQTFYVDGVNSEIIQAGETASTHIDGDQLGYVPNQSPPAYFWNGTPHASTSTRSGLTRAGGMVVPFKKYGFLLTAIIGLGLAVPQNVATEYARIDGGFDDYTRKPTRQFSLTGRFQGTTYGQLRDQRGRLSRLFDRDLIGQDQRLTLLRHVEDQNRQIVSSTARIAAKYEGGLSGNTDNQVAETAAITFTQYMPMIGSDGESGTSLSVQQSVVDTDYVAERLTNGTWRNISTSFNNQVLALLYANDGKLYIGGDFTAPQTRVGSWDGTTFSAMGAGLASSVFSLVEAPDGTIYAGGVSVTIGGVTGTVTRFTGGAWAVVGATGTMVDPVQQLLFTRDGNLYAAGTNAGGNATLRRWDGSAWSTIITGPAVTTFYALAEGANGLYVGGVFLNLNGDANQDNIAFYNIAAATWSALGSGVNGNIEGQGLTIGLDGRLYVTGNFTTAGGVSAIGAAVWNGASWSSLGSGLSGVGDEGQAQTMPDGTILMAGAFTTANGVTFPDPIARWNGGGWVPLDADLPTGTSFPVLSMDVSIDGKIAVGYNNTGNATTAATTTITNTGTARSYPVLTIKGPSSGTSRIWSILNTTTGRGIYFNYTINAGETAVLVLQPDNLSFISDFQGNVMNTIMPGSNVADFFLQPGVNIISFFSASSTVTATLFWRPNFVSIDDVP